MCHFRKLGKKVVREVFSFVDLLLFFSPSEIPIFDTRYFCGKFFKRNTFCGKDRSKTRFFGLFEKDNSFLGKKSC